MPGPGFGETSFVPVTKQQQFGPGPAEGHGYYSSRLKSFVWWGWIAGEKVQLEVKMDMKSVSVSENGREWFVNCSLNSCAYHKRICKQS